MTPQQVFRELARRYEDGEWVFSSNDESGSGNLKAVPAGLFTIIKEKYSDIPKDVPKQIELLAECRELILKSLDLPNKRNELYIWNDDDDRTQDNVIELLVRLSRV